LIIAVTKAIIKQIKDEFKKGWFDLFFFIVLSFYKNINIFNNKLAVKLFFHFLYHAFLTYKITVAHYNSQVCYDNFNDMIGEPHMILSYQYHLPSPGIIISF